MFTTGRLIRSVHWCVWTKPANNWSNMCRYQSRLRQADRASRDYEYEHNGTGNVFTLYAPLEGRLAVLITERRTTVDYAKAIQHLVDVVHPDAEQIPLVQDNLNSHKPASLYAAFPPDESRRLIDRLEIHYTPKHGSWLNMAELELRVLGRQ